MKFKIVVLFSSLFFSPTMNHSVHAQEMPSGKKLRVIVTTDGEVDDRCSMVRFLLYANEWEIRGLIHSSSKHHWKGDGNTPGKKWEPVEWLDRQLEAYAQVYPNLKLHDPGYPSPEYLKSQVFVGNIALEGDMREPTPGSNRIVQVLLDPDPSPVWLQAWGGSNTIARALKTIKDEHPGRVAEVSQKAKIYLITEQDNTLKKYLRPEWPKVQILRSGGPSFGAIAYSWQKLQPQNIQRYFNRDWMTANILKDHGPLCGRYEAKNGRFRSEGDTPAFLHAIPNGLQSDLHPAFGGWGGRFAFHANVWKSVDKNGSNPHSILRWAVAFQNDWAARADWCVKDYKHANHPPLVTLNHAANLKAKPGQTVTLSAKRTGDPDGDRIDYKWWHYCEASSYKNAVIISNTNRPEATFVVPTDVNNGETIHIVCEVTDKGDPPLTRYRRIIVTLSN